MLNTFAIVAVSFALLSVVLLMISGVRMTGTGKAFMDRLGPSIRARFRENLAKAEAKRSRL